MTNCTAWQDKARHNTTQHNTSRHTAAQHITPPRHTEQHSTTRHGAARQNAAPHSTARDNSTQHGTARRSGAERSTAQHGTAPGDTGKHSTAKHGTPKHTTAPGQGTLTVSLTQRPPPPHTPAGEETRPQQWDTTTPARHLHAKSRHTPGGTNLPTLTSKVLLQLCQVSSRKLQHPVLPGTGDHQETPDATPAPHPQRPSSTNHKRRASPAAPSRPHWGGGTLGTPKKRTGHPPPPSLMTPRNRLAQPPSQRNRSLAPTKRATNSRVYISHNAHGAGARPAETRKTNSKPVHHAAHRPVHGQ